MARSKRRGRWKEGGKGSGGRGKEGDRSRQEARRGVDRIDEEKYRKRGRGERGKEGAG